MIRNKQTNKENFMKKRTLLATTLLIAAVSNASDKAEFLDAQTGSSQHKLTTLCLKVDAMSINSMGPKGPDSQFIGLKIAEGKAVDLVTDKNMQTGECDAGYIEITTTAILRSIRNAPIGL